ncbi:MAG: hypothetical protein ACP5QT_03845 [Brevinematia bacterium]
MSDKNLPAFVLFREKLLSTKFNFFGLDSELVLTSECWQLINKVKKEFYFYSKYREKKFLRLRRIFFERDYNDFPEKYPDLFKKDSFNPSNFSQAIGGMSLDKNLLIGYFVKITQTDENYFQNFFEKPIIPFTLGFEVLKNFFNYFVTNSILPDGNLPEKIKLLERHCEDIERLCGICNYIAELFGSSMKEKTTFLRTGHIIEFVSGMNLYIEKLSRDLIENGFATLSIDDGSSILGVVDELKNCILFALKSMIIDILWPLINSINYRIEFNSGRLTLIDQNTYKKGFIERLLDLFLHKEEKVYEIETIQKEIERMKKGNKQSEPDYVKEKKFIKSESFIELLDLLKNFVIDLRQDLEPEFDPKGKLISLKQGFDQFDIPQNRRNIDPLRHTLTGKFSSKDYIDFNNNDEMVIKSIYWLYDRIQSILEANKINPDGIELDKAKSLVDEVRSLYFISKNEYNEIRIYGNFSKFKVFLNRLFGSKILQSKYHGMMKEILKCMDRCRIEIMQSEKNRRF